jgi:hypothetical protein
MEPKNIIKVCMVIVLLTVGTSCEQVFNSNQPDLSESLDPVEELRIIKGAENATLTVNANRENQAYFSINFSNIGQNNVIDNGTKDSWCIDVRKSIDSNQGRYEGIKLYSTYLVEKWYAVNYLLNIAVDLRNDDQDISWLEIQLAIWSLRGYPKFDLDETELEDLPGQFSSDGQPAFSYQKVADILDIVEEGYRNFDYTKPGTKFAVVAEMPVDIQTVITVVEKK